MSFLLKNLQIHVFSLIYWLNRKQLKEYVPPHVHMHSYRPILLVKRVGVPLWPRLFLATGP